MRSSLLCRCGQEKRDHPCLTGNGYRKTCLTYEPMDFRRFEGELTGNGYPNCCCCDLCNAVAHAVSLPLGDTATPTIALWDALVAGTHRFLGWDEWAEKLRISSPNERTYQPSGGFMDTGLGIGVTPGGVTGGKQRRLPELGNKLLTERGAR